VCKCRHLEEVTQRHFKAETKMGRVLAVLALIVSACHAADPAGTYKYMTWDGLDTSEDPMYTGEVKIKKEMDMVYSAEWDDDEDADGSHPAMGLLILENEQGGDEILAGGWGIDDDEDELGGALVYRLKYDDNGKLMMEGEWTAYDENTGDISRGVTKNMDMETYKKEMEQDGDDGDGDDDQDDYDNGGRKLKL